MNEEWQKGLMTLGVAEELQRSAVAGGAQVPASIGALAKNESPMLVELSSLAVVDIVGDDAQEFFQAQVCNDLTAISPGECQINGYCNPKGRLLALFTVYTHDDGYRLIIPEGVADAFVKRLTMFVLRAKVSVKRRADLVCSGMVLNAASADTALSDIDALPSLPLEPMGVSRNDSMHLLRWHDSQNAATAPQSMIRFLCVAAPEAMLTLWQRDAFERTGSLYWRWLDINAGVPNVFESSVEQFIPQMLNMQLINALSFKKGCYPGQEIVARMQYLGKLKKHMKHLRLPGATQVPASGDVLSSESNNNAGQVVDAVLDEEGLNLLAVVNIEARVDDISLFDNALQEAPMPYSLLAEES